MTKRKYTDDQIIDIRTRYADGESQSTLADEYDTTQPYISKIVLGREYADVGGPIANSKERKLSDEDIADIRKQRWSGDSVQEIAENWGIHPSYAGKITRYEVRA